MGLSQLWAASRSAQRAFPFRYAAYHHYRSHGWVPKSGIKYGVDFVLYKDGPSLSHAEYALVVIDTDLETKAAPPTSRMLSWWSLLNLNRVSESVRKVTVAVLYALTGG